MGPFWDYVGKKLIDPHHLLEYLEDRYMNR